MKENFYPSNGTEGQIFMEEFCDKCCKKNQCTILLNSLIGKHPKQWIYDEKGKSKCTSFNNTRQKKVKQTKNQLTLL